MKEEKEEEERARLHAHVGRRECDLLLALKAERLLRAVALADGEELERCLVHVAEDGGAREPVRRESPRDPALSSAPALAR
jgi:hypothetical protein